MSQDSITNRVAQSALVTFDLEDLWPSGGLRTLHLSEIAPEGLLREADARSYVRTIKKHTYQNAVLAIEGSEDFIVPQWLGPMLASSLADSVHFVGFGVPSQVLSAYYAQALAQLDWTAFKGARVLLKGCGRHPVPDTAYAAASMHLSRVALKLMYGEACSNVPLFKSEAEGIKP